MWLPPDPALNETIETGSRKLFLAGARPGLQNQWAPLSARRWVRPPRVSATSFWVF